MVVDFRVWHKKDKRMLRSVLNPYNFRSQASRFIMMQFTGLKDKNKKEIFIGDILKWDNQCTMVINPKNELGFYYDIITQKDKNICSFDIRFYRSEESAEIIGNIYENPKLLRRKKW